MLILFSLLVPYLTTVLELAGLPGMGVVSAAAAIVPYGLLTLNGRALFRREHVWPTTVVFIFAAWTSVILLGVVHGYAVEVIEQAAKVLGWGLFFFLCYLAEFRTRAGGAILIALGLSALPVASRILFGVMTGQFEYNQWQGQLQYGEISANKDIVHVVMSAFCLSLTIRGALGWKRAALLASLMALIAAVVLANVRIAQLGLVLVLLHLAWRSGGGLRVTLLGALSLLIGIASVRDRVLVRWSAISEGTHTGTVLDRVLWWQAGITEALSQSPIIGVGKSFRIGLGAQVFPLHSIFVQTFVESGVLGLLLLLGAAATLFVNLLFLAHTARRADVPSGPATTAAVITLFATYFGMSTSENTFLSGHQNWVFWGASGVFFGMLARARVLSIAAPRRPSYAHRTPSSQSLPRREAAASKR